MRETEKNGSGYQYGVLLLELLTAVTVMAMLWIFVVPWFEKINEFNRAAAEINALANDLQFARTQALNGGLSVTVCVASTDGKHCAMGDTPWNANGWIIFLDPTNLNETSSLQAVNIEPLRRRVFQSSSGIFLASNRRGKISVVTFASDGTVLGAIEPVAWTRRFKPPLDARSTRCLYLYTNGYQQVFAHGHATETGTCS
ncbi:GspH/FimT family pseudopilin [Variovorax atrisoli]|uniref:GspH/FimT family pseudopilin n=1 Tax=Variovorax atrisoli TaxID=3394203 RepID=UPI0009B72412|nr:GspH/FimT family protein [Variovorax paradoxus]